MRQWAMWGIILAFSGIECNSLFFAESEVPKSKTLAALNAALRGEANTSHRYELFAKAIS